MLHVLSTQWLAWLRLAGARRGTSYDGYLGVILHDGRMGVALDFRVWRMTLVYGLDLFGLTFVVFGRPYWSGRRWFTRMFVGHLVLIWAYDDGNLYVSFRMNENVWALG